VVLAHYLKEESEGAHPYASPFHAPDLSGLGLPPALVITAEYDPLRPLGRILCGARRGFSPNDKRGRV
jgi:acetyl esterase/lipase